MEYDGGMRFSVYSDECLVLDDWSVVGFLKADDYGSGAAGVGRDS